VCIQQAFDCSKCEGHGVFSDATTRWSVLQNQQMLGDDQQEAYLNRERTVRTTSIW